jgi:hypothetical protein
MPDVRGTRISNTSGDSLSGAELDTGTSLAGMQEQSHRKDPCGRSCRGALGLVAGVVKRRYPLPGATLRESW